MALEQIVKDLQAQNDQFQQIFLNLAKGQEELKTLITKENKKKIKGNQSTFLTWEEGSEVLPSDLKIVIFYQMKMTTRVKMVRV